MEESEIQHQETKFTEHWFNIESLHVKDFRRFRDFSVFFNLATREIQGDKGKTEVGPLTVLVAKNGMGKTSVLDAIRVLFGRYTAPFRFPSPVHFQKNDIRVFSDASSDELTQAESVVVSGKILLEGREADVKRELQAKKGQRTSVKHVACIDDFAQNVAKKRKADALTEWPLLAFYGTGRLWSEHRNRHGRRGGIFPSDYGYENCLGENHNFKAVDTWLYDALFAKFTSRLENLKEPTDVVRKLAAVETALNSVLGREGYELGLLLHPRTREVAVRQRSGNTSIPVPVSQLSDGVRAAFGLVADMAFRCALLNPQFGSDAPALTRGFVLVDEIDLHLHPEWQQRILNALQRAFPKLQFVVTTHSPQVVSSVPQECVRIIDASKREACAPDEQTEGATAQRMLNDVFGTSSRVPAKESEVSFNLSRYRELVEKNQWDSPEAKEILRFLNNKTPADPELAELAMVVHLKDYQRRHPDEANS